MEREEKKRGWENVTWRDAKDKKIGWYSGPTAAVTDVASHVQTTAVIESNFIKDDDGRIFKWRVRTRETADVTRSAFTHGTFLSSDAGSLWRVRKKNISSRQGSRRTRQRPAERRWKRMGFSSARGIRPETAVLFFTKICIIFLRYCEKNRQLYGHAMSRAQCIRVGIHLGTVTNICDSSSEELRYGPSTIYRRKLNSYDLSRSCENRPLNSTR